nr:glycosyltransferase [Fredinandcohnia onubensis]
MINLLFITTDRSQHIDKSPYYLSKELEKITNLTVWHNPGNLQDILSQLSTRPDFILLYDLDKMTAPRISGIKNVNIPFGLMVEDPDKNSGARGKFIMDNNIQYLFPVVRDSFLRKYPTLKDRIYWLPHHAYTEVFKDYQLPKTIDYLLIGKIDRLYPLRQKILSTMQNEPGFTYYKHPGYRSFSPADEKRRVVGENYAKKINQAKIFFTCDSILKYPIKKYFEVPACRTLLMAPTSEEIEDLGFVPGKNFVDINENDFYEKAKYYLTHEEERQKIADAGYEFIREYHSTKARAEFLVEKVNEIIENQK